MWAGSLLSLSFAAGLLASSEGSSAPVAADLLPDLIIWGPFTNPQIVTRNFDEDDCALDPFDPCIGAAGTRRLLRFGTETRNVGTADLVIGDPDPGPTGPPDLHPFYEWFECRDHPVLRKFDEFRLVDCYGYVYARSFKSVFCMVDSVYRGAAPSPGGQYHCGNQGIQVDFADLYYSTLPCQWLDITNLPPGDYVLEMETNAQRIIPELNFDNNITVVPVTISSVGPDDPDPVTSINGQSVATHTPTFQFTPFTNSDDSATQAGYQIQVRRVGDNGNDCDTIVYDTGFISDTSSTTHTYQPGAFSSDDPALGTPRLSEPLACETLYTWAVRYSDTNGDWSHWSDDGTGINHEFQSPRNPDLAPPAITCPDDHIFDFFRYFGDTDGDRDVDFLDLINFGVTFQKTLADDPDEYDFRFDADMDGDVDFLDLIKFGFNFPTTFEAISCSTELLQNDTASDTGRAQFDAESE